MSTFLNLPALVAFLDKESPVPAPSPAVQEPVSAEAIRWLEQLAALLNCTPDWLLSTGRIAPEDLVHRGPLGATARLIRSYNWEEPPPLDRPRPAAPIRHETKPYHQNPQWLGPRDAYLNHLMACKQCHAYRLRNPVHCPQGADLRLAYDQATQAHQER